MADRYWVGGSGTWSTTSTTNWSATSGGTGGASVPLAADNVFFNQAATYTVTMTGALNCTDITVSAGAVTFQSTGTLNIRGSLSFITGTVWNTTGLITFNSLSGTRTISSGGTTFNNSFNFNSTGGNWALQSNLTTSSTSTTTLTAGVLSLGTYTLSTGIFNSSGTTARTLAFDTGKIVTTSATTSTVWNTATITGLTVTGTRLVECQGGGGAVTKTISPGAITAANSQINFSILDSNTAYAITGSSTVGDLLLNGTQTLSNTPITIYGSFTRTNGSIGSGTSVWTFAGTGTKTITTNGLLCDFPWTFNGTGGQWNLLSAVTLGTTRTTTLTTGTLDLSGFTYSTGSFATGLGGTKALVFDGGTLAITGFGATAFNNANPADFTTSAGTANGRISMTSGSSKAFIGGGTTYSGVILNQGGVGVLNISGSNTFEDISASISSSGSSTITFPVGLTNTFNTFTITGTASFQTTLTSFTYNARATINSPQGVTGFVTGANYIRIRDISFTPRAFDGTDYLRWYIGSNSTILSNCRGVIAATYLAESTPIVYAIETGTTWTAPANFNFLNNIVHLIGGGGGGEGGRSVVGGSVRGGFGGGGGGYTRIINYNASPGSVVSYSVGVGGAGGASGGGATTNPGTNGGNTTFGAFTAGGGGGGQNTSSAGGTGTTFNGGAGGSAGAAGTQNNSWHSAGGGGGGAAGNAGAGANGGNGVSASNNSVGAGGGGGGSGGSVGSNGIAGSTSGGVGGNNSAGVGGATTGVASFSGGGGQGGLYNTNLGIGSDGISILNSFGGGGGSGGAGSNGGSATAVAVTNVSYGGGGGGAAADPTAGRQGGGGARGLIVIQYLPGTATTDKFFLLFM